MNNEEYQEYNNALIRWPGSGSLDVASLTIFGNYNNDAQFIRDCIGASKWACLRLGYPTVDVELVDKIIYPAFEESVNEYNAKVNEFNAINNMIALQGQTISSTNGGVTGKVVNSTGLERMTIIARDYGSEAGSGGNYDWKMASFQVYPNRQTYDLQELIGFGEDCNRIEIKRIFHDRPPAFQRIYDPFSMTGMSYSNILTELGFGAYSPATQFLMCPIFEDMLRGQAIQFNDLVRKSAFSFHVANNKVTLFPVPECGYKCHIQYTTDNIKLENNSLYGDGTNVISDLADIPYSVHPYSSINDAGRQWIRKYFLANCKEILGCIRQKVQTLPIPGGETTLDGAELRSEAQQEKQLLQDNLKEILENTSKYNQMEKQSAYNSQLMDNLKAVPLGLYIF